MPGGFGTANSLVGPLPFQSPPIALHLTWWVELENGTSIHQWCHLSLCHPYGKRACHTQTHIPDGPSPNEWYCKQPGRSSSVPIPTNYPASHLMCGTGKCNLNLSVVSLEFASSVWKASMSHTPTHTPDGPSPMEWGEHLGHWMWWSTITLLKPLGLVQESLFSVISARKPSTFPMWYTSEMLLRVSVFQPVDRDPLTILAPF